MSILQLDTFQYGDRITPSPLSLWDTIVPTPYASYQKNFGPNATLVAGMNATTSQAGLVAAPVDFMAIDSMALRMHWQGKVQLWNGGTMIGETPVRSLSTEGSVGGFVALEVTPTVARVYCAGALILSVSGSYGATRSTVRFGTLALPSFTFTNTPVWVTTGENLGALKRLRLGFPSSQLLGPGAYAEWLHWDTSRAVTPSPETSPNWQYIDKRQDVSDSQHLFRRVPGVRDTYAMFFIDAPTSPEGTVLGVQYYIVGSTDVAGRSVTPICLFSGSLYDMGVPIVLSASAATYLPLFTINPATGLPWTFADILNPPSTQLTEIGLRAQN